MSYKKGTLVKIQRARTTKKSDPPTHNPPVKEAHCTVGKLLEDIEINGLVSVHGFPKYGRNIFPIEGKISEILRTHDNRLVVLLDSKYTYLIEEL